MGLSTKFINSTTLDLAKAARKYVYDNGKALKSAQTKLKLRDMGFLKSNGGIDIKKVADEFTKELVEDGICNEKGIMNAKLIKEKISPKMANMTVKDAFLKLVNGEF